MKRSVPKIRFTAWLCFAVVLFTELSTVICSNTTESTNSTGNDFRSFSRRATSKSSLLVTDVDTVGPTTLNTKSHYKETSALVSSSSSLGKFRDIYHSSRIITASSITVSSNELIGDNLQTKGSAKAEISTKKAGEAHSPTLLSITPALLLNFASFSVSQSGKTVSNFLSESVRTIAIEDIQGSTLKTNIGTNKIAPTTRSTPKQELKASSFVKSSDSSHTPIVSHRLSSTITPTLSKLPSQVQSHVEGETLSRFRGHKSLSTQEYTLGTNKLSTQVSSYTVLLKSSSHRNSSEVLSSGNWQKSKSPEDSPSMNTFESSKLVTTTTLKLDEHQFQNTSDVSYLVSPSSSLLSLADQATPMIDSTVTNVNTNITKTSDLIARPITTPTIPQLSTSVGSVDLQSTTTVYKTAEYDTRVSETVSTQGASLTTRSKITTSVVRVRTESSLGSTKSLNLSLLHVVSSLTASQTSKSSTFNERSVRALPSTSKLEHFQSESSDSQSRYTTDGIISSKASAQGSSATTELSGIKNISETRNPTISTETSNDVATLDSRLRSTLKPSFTYHDSLSSASVFESTSSKSTPHLELSHREPLSTTTTTVFATSDLAITTALEHYSLSSAATNDTFVTSGTSGIQSSISSPSKITIHASINPNATAKLTSQSKLTTASEHSDLSSFATNDAFMTSSSTEIQSSIGSPSKIIYSSIDLNATAKLTSQSKLTTASEHSALSSSPTNPTFMMSGTRGAQSSISSPSKITHASTTEPTSQSMVNPKFSTNVNIISRNTSMTPNLGSVLEPTPLFSNTIQRLNQSLSVTITNTSAKLNSTWRQTAVQTSSISSTRESRVTQYCISDTGEQCVCYEGTQVVKGVPVCTQLLNQHERRSVVGIELEKLVDSEKLENRTKDIIAEVVNRACNNGSYQCVPTSENHLNSLSSSYTSPSLHLETSIITNTSKNETSFQRNTSKNVSITISKTIVKSANSSTHIVKRNFSISTANSQNFSKIKPWRTYSTITVNPSVKFKKKRRRRSLITQPTLLIRVTADDVMVVEMRPVEGTKPALLAFLVRYRVLNGSGNGSSILEAGTLRSILVNNTRYLEGKLNVSIRDVGLWINRVTSETTMWKTSIEIYPTRALVSSHPGGSSPMVRWSTGQSDDDYKIMTVAIALGVSCVIMLLVMIAIVMTRMNSKRQGEFIPGDNLNGTITPDHNTQEMIAAAVDPAPRITDVPYKSPKAKKTTTMNLKRPEHMTSET